MSTPDSLLAKRIEADIPVSVSRHVDRTAEVEVFRKKYIRRGLVVQPVPEGGLDHEYWLSHFRGRTERLKGRQEAHNSEHKFSLECTSDFQDSQAGLSLLSALRPILLLHFNDVCQIDSSGALNIELFTAFAIWYRFDDKQANSSLRLHRDDSDITVNLCLLSEQDGCAVSFEGDHRLTSAQSKGGLPHSERTVVNIPAGWVLLHHGGHPTK